MSRSRTPAPPTPPDALAEPEAALELASWRHAHEVRALHDTLAIYRRCVAALAAENARLNEELSNLSGRAMRPGRTRGGYGARKGRPTGR